MEFAAFSDDAEAGVAEGGGTGVGDEGDGFAVLEFLDEEGGLGGFVFVAIGEGGFFDVEVLEKVAGDAGIFAGNKVAAVENISGPERDVF